MTSSNLKKSARRTDKAEAILKGAMQEFMASGYGSASMDGIAAAAGVSKPTLYNYFRDKETLFVALVQKLVQGRFQHFFTPPHQRPNFASKEGKVILRELAYKVVDKTTNEPQFLNFMRTILGESGRFPELARTFVSTVETTAFQSITHIFATCPDLRTPDPEVAARIFVGTLVHFMITQKLLHGEEIMPMDSERLIDGLIDTLTR